MHLDISTNGLRIRGKAWEVRAKLRDLAQNDLSLQKFLMRNTQSEKKNHYLRGV